MQSPLLSLDSIFEALDLDAERISLLQQVPTYAELLHANTPETVCRAIRTIGNTLDTSQKAQQLAESIEERMDIIVHKLKFITEENKPNVLFLRDVFPASTLYNAYLETLVRIAGGHIIPPTQRDSQHPDVIMVISDKPVSQLLTELPDRLLSAPEWSQTAAVRNGKVFIIHAGFLRQPGAGIADDTELLAEILQPNYFIFGRDEDAWMPFVWQ